MLSDRATDPTWQHLTIHLLPARRLQTVGHIVLQILCCLFQVLDLTG